MDTGQLETFDRIVREGSFSRAAVALGIGQPAVSSRIQSLEETLGGALFTRGRVVALTPLGEAFLPYARRALEVVREGVESAQLVQVGKRGRIRLGVLGSLAPGLAGPALVRFLEQHPEVDHTVRATDHESLLRFLGDGIVDLSFVVWPVAPPIADTLAPLFVLREAVVLVAHPEHPLARRRAVTPQDVAMLSRPLVRLRWWPQHDPRVTELADRSGTATDLPMEVARHLVLAGIGAGFFARTYVRADLEAGVLVEIAVRGMAPLHRDIALVRRRGSSLSPAAAALVQALRVQAGRIGLAPKPPPSPQRAPSSTRRRPRSPSGAPPSRL
jgi:DNA-binding transcriptional LysR family regulator